jgi:hypothetical protein
MKKLSLTTVFVLIVLWGGCNKEVQQSKIEKGTIPTRINAFWGDSSAVFVAKELQNGYRIKVGLTNVETVGIDTPEDLKRAEAFLISMNYSG